MPSNGDSRIWTQRGGWWWAALVLTLAGLDGCGDAQREELGAGIASLDTLGTIVLYEDSLASVMDTFGESSVRREEGASGSRWVCYVADGKEVIFEAGPLGGWDRITGYRISKEVVNSGCAESVGLSEALGALSVKVGQTKSDIESKLGPGSSQVGGVWEWSVEDAFEGRRWDIVRVLRVRFVRDFAVALEYYVTISS